MDDFKATLTSAVELADAEKGWEDAEYGPNHQATKVLRSDVTTYEGSKYRVVIIAIPDTK